MANVEIQNLPPATTPLGGSDVIPIVQSGVTKSVTISDGNFSFTDTANTFTVDQTITADLLVDGNVGIGLTPDSVLKFQVQPSSASGGHLYVASYDTGSGGANANAEVGVINYNNDGYGDGFYSRYARGTKASPAAVQSGDEIGYFSFYPYDGTSFIGRAWINAKVDGAVSTGTAPTALAFHTGSTASPTERLRISSTGQLSAVVPGNTTLYPAYFARAWVNFDGTGTVAIRASGNVTSIGDNGAGNYTINFTTAMPDTSYAVVSSEGWNLTAGTANGGATSTTAAYLGVFDGADNTNKDSNTVNVAVFR
jgi:hypothetical protein